jgi:ABC-type multidrug transport system fused ATPase/permease subunit
MRWQPPWQSMATITVGTYTAYVGLLGWIIWPLRNLGRLIVQMSESMVSFGRISDVLKEEREPLSAGNSESDVNPLRGELRFENVSFQYGQRSGGTAQCGLRACSRDRVWRCSAPPVRARPRWSTCCRASTT